MSLFDKIFNGKKEHNRELSLTSFLRGLNYAVSSAGDMTRKHFAQLFETYYKYNEVDDVYEPEVMNFKIDEENIVPLPLITLEHGRGHILKKFKTSFYVKIKGVESIVCDTEDEVCQIMKEYEDTPDIMVQLTHNEDCHAMFCEVEYECIEAAESLMRLSDINTNMVVPVKVKKNEPN